MRVLVTGGAGFIGHHLVAGLLAEGHEAVVLDDLSIGDPTRLHGLDAGMTFIRGDIRDAEVMARAMTGCEVVLHHAALSSVARSLADPGLTDSVNVGGTLTVMRCAARAGVRRVVLAGSAAVYGTTRRRIARESDLPRPMSPYAVSKLAAEHYLHVLGTQTGVETVALRYFNVFGPGQDPASDYAAAVPRFTTDLLAGRQPTIFGDGRQSRDFTYIDDVVRADLLAMRADAPAGITVNIGTGQARSVLELLAAIVAATGRDLEPRFAPARPGELRHSRADISSARTALGYEARTGFKDAVRRTVQSYDVGQRRSGARGLDG